MKKDQTITEMFTSITRITFFFIPIKRVFHCLTKNSLYALNKSNKKNKLCDAFSLYYYKKSYLRSGPYSWLFFGMNVPNKNIVIQNTTAVGIHVIDANTTNNYSRHIFGVSPCTFQFIV